MAEWFKSIGLDMYSDLVTEKSLTGERLAEFVAADDCHQLVVSDQLMGFVLFSHLISVCLANSK